MTIRPMATRKKTSTEKALSYILSSIIILGCMGVCYLFIFRWNQVDDEGICKVLGFDQSETELSFPINGYCVGNGTRIPIDSLYGEYLRKMKEVRK